MTAYTNISNALVAVGAKPFATTVQAFRDNLVATAEGDVTAPVNAYGWHPFNKVTVGDTNTGLIWSFQVNGAVAAVTTPDFQDGWEYALLMNEIRSNSATASEVNINLFRQTSGVYTGAGGIAGSASQPVSTTASLSAWIELQNVRKVRRSHGVQSFLVGDGSDGGLSTTGSRSQFIAARHTTAQKILRAQLTVGTGSISGSGSTGQIFLYRRRDPGGF